MPDETNTTEATAVEQKMVVPVERCGTTIDFVEHTISRGDKKDTVYLSPVVEEKNLSKVIEWLSPKVVASILYGRVKMWAQNVYKNSLDKEGKLVLNKFVQYASTYSVRGGEKISDLREELSELQSELLKLDLSIAGNPSHPQFAEVMAKFTELGKEMQDVQAQIELKERDKKESEAAPAATT